LRQKIEQILQLLAKEKNIGQVLIATRGPVYITGQGFGPAKNRFNPGAQIKSMNNPKTDSSREAFFDGLNKTVDYIIKSDKKIAYFLENPELGMLPRNCLGRPLLFNGDRIGCDVNVDLYKNRMDDYRAGVFGIKKHYPGMLLLDPESLFCDAQVCTGIKNDKLLYADENHISIDGSKYVGSNMAMQLLSE
jgi:hypothetical protein